MLTSYDIVTSIQLLMNCNLTVCTYETRHEIKKCAPSFYSVPVKTPKTKLKGIPLKDIEGATFQMKTTPSRQIFPKGARKKFYQACLLILL